MRRSAGFTLLEALLVTAVLTVLAALLLVALGPARKMARVSSCAANMRQIGMAYKMYVSDYGQYPPPSAQPLLPYLRGRQSLYCPEDTTYLPAGAASSYEFHFLVPPRFTPIQQQRELDPNVVLLDCANHIDQGARVDRQGNTHLLPPAYPFHLALRASGSVQRVPLSQVRTVLHPGHHLDMLSLYPGEPGYDEARN